MGRFVIAAVQVLWVEFAVACEYVPIAGVAEARHMFSEFEAVEL
jgi:hypothetical protein